MALYKYTDFETTDYEQQVKNNSQSKGDQPEKLVAFVLPIERERSSGDPVKTEYDEDQGAALVESDEEAVELRSTALLRMAAKHSAAIFCGTVRRTVPQKAGRPDTRRRANGECQDCWGKGSRGTRFPLAELRGGSLLSGRRGETSGAGRGQGPAQLSVGNRH